MASDSPYRITLVVSDFHLGTGARLKDGRPNPMEDFPYDSKFVEFLEYYSSGEFEHTEIDLVINGDFFNHIQVFPPDDKSPHYITESKALQRTRRILDGHKELFAGLSKFASSPGKRVVFTPGNHDPGLFFPAVQDLIADEIEGNVVFVERAYVKDGLYVEHGDRYDPFHRLMPPYTEIVSRGIPEPVVNTPWGTYFFLNIVLPLKKKRPYVDKVVPFRNYLIWAMFNDFFLFVLTMLRLVFFVLKMIVVRKSWQKFPIVYILSLMKTLTISPDLKNGAARIFYRYPELKMVVFGHTHQATFVPMPGGRSYYNTGCWNEVTGMEPSHMGTHRKFTYLVVYHRDQAIEAKLMIWNGLYHPAEEFFG